MARHNYKCTAEMHARCVNNALCHLCDGESLFKDPKAEREDKFRKRKEKKEDEKNALFKTHKKEKKEGMGFEKRVQKQWNNKFGSKKKKVAKPRLDMQIEEEMEADHPDTDERTTFIPPSSSIDKFSITRLPKNKQQVKKRDEAQRQFNSGAFWHSKGDIKLEHALMECKERGTTNARGEKQITIPKHWLDKQAKEAFQENRPYWYIPFAYKNSEDIYLVKPYDHEIEMIYEMRNARERIEELEDELSKLKGENNE